MRTIRRKGASTMPKILFVEDDEASRGAFVKFLTVHGHQVTPAGDGEQAIALAAKESFDIIFMDIKMPKLDGLTACRQIRTACPSAKVVLITGYHMDDQLHRVADDGAVEWLRKPLTHHVLVDVMRRVLPGSMPDLQTPPPAGPR